METRERRWKREREVEERSDSRVRVWEGKRWRSWRQRKERAEEVAEMSVEIAVERWLWWLDSGRWSLDWVFDLSLFFLPFRLPRRLLVAPPAVVIAGGGDVFKFPLGSWVWELGAAALTNIRCLSCSKNKILHLQNNNNNK